jgi:hypothetical protein
VGSLRAGPTAGLTHPVPAGFRSGTGVIYTHWKFPPQYVGPVKSAWELNFTFIFAPDVNYKLDVIPLKFHLVRAFELGSKLICSGSLKLTSCFRILIR